jgi:hypothetical protein
MVTRAASAAPIQRVLRESGIQDPLPLANRKLNTVKTTLNPGYSGARKHCPFGQVLATCFTYARIARKRRSMKNPTSSVECGTSWLEKATWRGGLHLTVAEHLRPKASRGPEDRPPIAVRDHRIGVVSNPPTL